MLARQNSKWIKSSLPRVQSIEHYILFHYTNLVIIKVYIQCVIEAEKKYLSEEDGKTPQVMSELTTKEEIH